MKYDVKIPGGSYAVTIEKGGISGLKDLWDLDRRVLVVTDDGVPSEYAKTVSKQCREGTVVTLPQGEATKCETSLSFLWQKLVEGGFTRGDAVVAVGGGVVGDLAGFAAATYMRGIDFYNVPTTVLSQVDSSVGGKTAIDFGGVKNIVGAFYAPRGVMIDADVLRTLPARQVSNGLAEAVKIAATLDAELFSYIEDNDPAENIEKIIVGAVGLKAAVVEKDYKEAGLRRVLNFGHTAAHAIESASGFSDILHGEAVAIGMVPMAEGAARERIVKVLEKLSLPTKLPASPSELTRTVYHDKKMAEGKVRCIVCPEIGRWREEALFPEEFERKLYEAVEK